MSRRKLLVVLIILLLMSSVVQSARRSGRRRARGRVGGTDFGGVGRGIGKMIQSWREEGEEEQELISGSETTVQYNSRKFHQDMTKNDTWIIVGLSIVVVVGIAVWLRSRAQPVQERFDRVRMRERDAQMVANYAVTKAIAEHGVHPARARGDNYRINLR